MRERPDFYRNRNSWVGRETRIPGLLLFGHYQFLEAESALVEHQHEDGLEICFLVRGEQTYRVGEDVYRLQGGDQFVTFPNEWHDTAGEPQRGELYWILLEGKRVPEDALLLRRPWNREVISRLKKLPTRRFRGGPQALACLMRIEAMLRQEKVEKFEVLRAGCALHEYLLETIRAAEEGEEKEPDRRIRDALDWMESHLHEPARVSEVATAMGWSEAHFKAVFRREMGQGPHEYFLKRKIERAKYLLIQEGKSVTEVAMELGFSSSQHFATAFRKFTDQTPSAVKAGRVVRAEEFLTKREAGLARARERRN